MKEVVIVPTFQRQELLYLVLEAIRESEPDIPILVFPDRGTREQEICRKFNAVEHLLIPHSLHGNSYNTLEAYKYALTKLWDRLFIIEDDAVIHPTFFSWCRDALDRHPDTFAACGWRYSPNALVGDGPDIQIPWFLSVATCLPRSSVQSIAAHALPQYYNEMQKYVDAAFPQSPNRGSLHYEQDGLTLRIMQAQGKRCVWPRRPRVTHCGFHGYHMGENRMTGTLEERVSILRFAVQNPSILQRIMSGGRMPELTKCISCRKPLITERKNRAECVDCFHRVHPELPRSATFQYYLPPVLGTSSQPGLP